MTNGEPGRFFVLSAPSGSGKTTVAGRLLARRPELVYSVSFTTRPPRPGEVDGRDYNFVTEARFRNMIKAGDFLEWTEVFGRFYGTGRPWVEERLKAGRRVLADLDVRGGKAVRALMPEAVLIFMTPPSAGELRRRLSGRRTESAQELERRLENAKAEIEASHIYDFLLINDRLEETVNGLEEIIFQGRGRRMAEAGAWGPVFFHDQESG
ncbi:MAG: guanylate kinase [Candidatus Adiutrix sp.]|jgi:guanylate kinase|nr:guanylate kinase [Candidatus Adiutrix sp.]